MAEKLMGLFMSLNDSGAPNVEVEHESLKGCRVKRCWIDPDNDEFNVSGIKGLYGSDTHKVPADLEQREVPYKEIYPTFEEYVEWCGEGDRDPETGKIGYWENPNAKWDYWTCPGRYPGRIHAHGGWKLSGSVFEPYKSGGFDCAELGDMVFERDDNAAELAEKEWRVHVDGETIDGIYPGPFNARYYTEKYLTKENYVLCQSTQWWRAVVTPDGKWHEPGEVLMFGMSTDTNGEIVEWAKRFKERFIDPFPPRYRLTIVDCHI